MCLSFPEQLCCVSCSGEAFRYVSHQKFGAAHLFHSTVDGQWGTQWWPSPEVNNHLFDILC